MMFNNACTTEILSEGSIVNLQVNFETVLSNYFLNRYILCRGKKNSPYENCENNFTIILLQLVTIVNDKINNQLYFI